MSSARDRAIALTKEARRRAERAPLERSLYAFVKAAWPYIDTAPFQESWALEAVCLHLEAVTRGDIRRLLINLPPRCGKSKIVSVCWNAWTWLQADETFTSGAGVNFLFASYNDKLSLELATDCRKLMRSAWFQRLWGERIRFSRDDNAKSSFSNTDGGARRSTSVGGSLLGIGGQILAADDPHNTEAVESAADRETVKRWWSEFSTTRMNDPKRSAIVVVMQRLHEEDVSGLIMSSPDFDQWTHLMLPMRHDIGRHCVTDFWEDPRKKDGELLWPERFGLREIGGIERELGPYLASGRLQQLPAPASGGILEKRWWKPWVDPSPKLDKETGKLIHQYPECKFVMASVDTAYTEKESNDPTGFVVLGIFTDPVDRCDKAILLYAWRKHLKLRGFDCDRKDTESYQQWKRRTQERWGLVEWIGDSCKRYSIDHLVIESKASGLSVIDEIKRIYATEGWHVLGKTPEGDKESRAVSIQGLLSGGLVYYSPDSASAATVIEETSMFPKHRYRDLTDALTQGLSHLRKIGRLRPQEEVREAEFLAGRYQPELVPLYDV